MKTIYFYLIIFFLLNSHLASAQKFFDVKGKEIIGTDGKPFIIRGTNMGNWLLPEGYMFRFEAVNSPRLINTTFSELIGPEATKQFWKRFVKNYISQDDIAYLKKIGVNSLRIPFHYKLFTNEDYLGENNHNRGFQIFDELLKWCRKYNMPILLDMHAAPGGQTGDNIDDSYGYPFLIIDRQSKDLTIKIWTAIAKKYKNEKLIMGYDLLNEPIAHYFDVASLNPYLEPLYKEIVAAIRTVDKNHIIFLGGAQWDTNFNIFGKPFDDKLVYTFHTYWTPVNQVVIQDKIDFRDKYNVPIYCGETGEKTNQWVDSFRVLLEKNDIGWHYWPYKKLDNERGFVTFNKPPLYDSIISYTKQPRSSFDEIRKTKIQYREQIAACLDQFLEACLYKNCRPNEEYIKALGFKP